MLRPTSTINQYQDIIGRLAVESQRVDQVDAMIRFLIGDMLVQGEEIFGEDYACVFGVQIKWAYATVQNIIRVSRVIPPEIRKIGLSHRFYTDIAAAELPRDIMHGFVRLAENYKAEGRSKWRRDVLEKVQEYKVDELTKDLPEATRNKFLGLWQRAGRPHWRILKQWIDGTKPVPIETETVGRAVVRLMDAKLPKEKFVQMSYEQVREAVAEAMYDLAKAVRSRLVAAEGEK
jgi:hypothetical protein